MFVCFVRYLCAFVRSFVRPWLCGKHATARQSKWCCPLAAAGPDDARNLVFLQFLKEREPGRSRRIRGWDWAHPRLRQLCSAAALGDRCASLQRRAMLQHCGLLQHCNAAHCCNAAQRCNQPLAGSAGALRFARMMRIRRVLLVVDRLKAAVFLRVFVLFLAVGCGAGPQWLRGGSPSRLFSWNVFGGL